MIREQEGESKEDKQVKKQPEQVSQFDYEKNAQVVQKNSFEISWQNI